MQNLRLVNLQGKKCAMFHFLIRKVIFDPCDLENEVKVKVTWVIQHGWTYDRCNCMQNFRLVSLQGKNCVKFQFLIVKAIFDPCDLENEVKV